MIRKYFALTPVLLLLTLPSLAMANTTYEDEFAANQDASSTGWHLSATYQADNATNQDNSATLAAKSAADAQNRHFLSTADDYTTHTARMQEQKMLNLLNQDRKNNGLAPLTWDEDLAQAARLKSADMRVQGYFAHESPTYGSARQMLTNLGYRYKGAGENIAHHATVEKAQAAFLSSPGHRRNIMSANWEKIGVGVVFDEDGFVFVTQLFAR